MVMANWRKTLCHGTLAATNSDGGQDYGHAWVERDQVWSYRRVRIASDYVTMRTMSAADYREINQARNVVEYDAATMLDLLLDYKHWGPWDNQVLDPKPKPLSAIDWFVVSLRKVEGREEDAEPPLPKLLRTWLFDLPPLLWNQWAGTAQLANQAEEQRLTTCCKIEGRGS